MQAKIVRLASSGRGGRFGGGRVGFTLVELLVVIGIIAVLVAMLLPALNKARFMAGQLACLSNVRQLATATVMYVNDNNGSFPRFDGLGANHWTSLLFPYVGHATGVFECPLNPYFYDWPDGGTLTVNSKTYTARLCYKVNGMGVNVSAANHNTAMLYPFGPIMDYWNGTTNVEPPDPNNPTNPLPRTMRMGGIAPDTILILDGFTQSNNVGLGDASSRHFGGPSNLGAPNYFGVRSIGVASHLGRSASIAFADNHCETVPVDTITHDPGYQVCVPFPSNEVPLTALNHSNSGRGGDIAIPWNNTNAVKGYWTGTKGD